MITFLIAGHETTASLLTFALHNLAKHPEVLARATSEVDALRGDQPYPRPGFDEVGRLRYVRQILNESLRLLDAIVQLAVLDRDLTAPAGSPADGDRHIVAAGATGLWTGWDLNIAYWADGAWTRLVPRLARPDRDHPALSRRDDRVRVAALAARRGAVPGDAGQDDRPRLYPD